MSMDLTGITNKNEYYTNHYFATVFEDNASETISAWNTAAKEAEEVSTPWSRLQRTSPQFYAAHDRYMRPYINMAMLADIRMMADMYLDALGYPSAMPEIISIDDSLSVPVYLEMIKKNGAPLLWIVLSASEEKDAGIMESHAFNAESIDEDMLGNLSNEFFREQTNEELATKVLFGQAEPPRFLMLISMNQIALIDRNKWNEKRYLQFELEEIFARRERTTLQAMSVLLHCESLCPDDGKILLDELDEQSQKNASGVSQDLKYSLRESIELLGNEVLYDMSNRQGRDLESNPVDAGQLTIECLRYMYRMLFVLFIEARPELGYAPIKAQSYYSGYSLESLRDIADSIRDDVEEVGDGYYLHETLAKLYDLIYNGYPKTEEELEEATGTDSIHDMFLIAPLKAHIFDPEYTPLITNAKLRNSCMLRIIDLMSLTRPSGKGKKRQRISYANLGINQMGAVYEALLSYRGFIAEQNLYEVKKAKDSFNELDVGYFVPEKDLEQYKEDERVRYESGEKKGKLRMYKKGTFIYRLAGREREKSASYYTPEVLTKCLVKYALKELLEGKTADEILELTICEPAMGSAAFLNEAINQLAEAYITRKEQETGEVIGYENRFNELQKVKMFIADRNVYGIDLNPIAVELAEVSLWLNTIHEGGYVPWFGTQLVNGNSLIGARRQCYRVGQLTTKTKGLRWYENAPERVPLGTKRAERNHQQSRKQIYHFLLGDPGMCSYNDKVIKKLDPDNINSMKNWNKQFIKEYTDSELATLLRLSNVIDQLWEEQVKLRKEIEEKTQDTLSVFGREDNTEDSQTTIRQKDTIFNELYKSEHMKNAGPYARLKFAMDYWCALWFWPIDKADLLPTRSEFFFDMSLILEGTMRAVDNKTNVQLSLFPTETEQIAIEIADTYGLDTIVDIPKLRAESERLNLVYKIAERNHFMHWELEFADLFVEKGGFDLIIGNPPWIKLTWNEQSVLADKHPMFAVKKLTAAETTKYRNVVLQKSETFCMYFDEYESLSGTQNYLNAVQNYDDLRGQQTNLFKCFLPQAWMYCRSNGVSAYVHPDGVFDDPNGGILREKLYPRLRKHFQFTNELRLFEEVHHCTVYSLNIYCNNQTKTFDVISNLFAASTVDDSYSDAGEGEVPGIKNEDGKWETKGHKRRIVRIGKSELLVFAQLLDSSENWKQARLPVIHATDYLDVLKSFVNQTVSIASLNGRVASTEMWHEVNDQNNGTIIRNVHSPKSKSDAILSGPHIGVANPLFKTSRRICRLNSDFDSIDLSLIDDAFIQRCNYSRSCDVNTYNSKIVDTPWGKKFNEQYMVCSRKMLNLSGERTLITAVLAPEMAFINGIFGMSFTDNTALVAGSMASVPYDFYLRVTGKSNGRLDTFAAFPVLINKKQTDAIAVRSLMLNCLTSHYADLWKREYKDSYQAENWSKSELRLKESIFRNLSDEWTRNTTLRTDYERRQALVEIDVLVSMALGMTLDQLKSIYRIQFPVLNSYEAETWYDANGRIVFTNNRSLVGVGFSRQEWENGIKGASSGKKFYRTITDDTMPCGPVERTIEYVAPFDRCDREQDYEIAWKFFEEKYNYQEVSE